MGSLRYLFSFKPWVKFCELVTERETETQGSWSKERPTGAWLLQPVLLQTVWPIFIIFAVLGMART